MFLNWNRFNLARPISAIRRGGARVDPGLAEPSLSSLCDSRASVPCPASQHPARPHAQAAHGERFGLLRPVRNETSKGIEGFDTLEEAHKRAPLMCLKYAVTDIGLYELLNQGRSFYFSWEAPKEPKFKARPYQKWSSKDDKQLLKLVNAGVAYKKIAGLMGRSYKSITVRAARLKRNAQC